MNAYAGCCKVVLLLVVSSVVPAMLQAQALSLRHGTYVQKQVDCTGAPNAAIEVWDGRGFSGAHSSKCTSRIPKRDGDTFQISTTCAALGDGTPDLSSYSDEVTLKRISKTAFTLAVPKEKSASYRWCPAG